MTVTELQATNWHFDFDRDLWEENFKKEKDYDPKKYAFTRTDQNGKEEEGFNPLQVHWHTPSEHTINGKHYDAEAHVVHADKDGKLAVVGIVFSM